MTTTGQLAFDIFGSAERTDRLFLALFPPPDIAQRIIAVRQSFCESQSLRGSHVSADRLHLTLCHLGDHAGVPPHIVPEVTQAAKKFSCAPFPIRLNRLTRFASNYAKPMLVLCGDDNDLQALRNMHQQLGQALARAGLGKYVDKQFTPHITLSYGVAEFAEQSVDPIEWTVTEFSLVHSLLGKTQHKHLNQWSLN